MQDDPIKPKLKPPETKRLKLNYDEPLSRFAFKFSLRNYSSVTRDLDNFLADGDDGGAPAAERAYYTVYGLRKQADHSRSEILNDPEEPRTAASWLGRVVQVDPIKPTMKAPGAKRLKLKYDEVLSNFAYNLNLRCYSWGTGAGRRRRRWGWRGAR